MKKNILMLAICLMLATLQVQSSEVALSVTSDEKPTNKTLEEVFDELEKASDATSAANKVPDMVQIRVKSAMDKTLKELYRMAGDQISLKNRGALALIVEKKSHEPNRTFAYQLLQIVDAIWRESVKGVSHQVLDEFLATLTPEAGGQQSTKVVKLKKK